MARQPQKTEQFQSLTQQALAQDARLKPLIRPLRLTWAGLWAERIARCFWPLWVIFLLTFSALAFGLHDIGSRNVMYGEFAAALIAALIAAIWGLRRFERPSLAQALTRLDHSLQGQPIDALLDQPAMGQDDPASLAVWQAHLEQMEQKIQSARPIAPHFHLAPRDPYGLRYMALTTAVIAASFGSLWRAGSALDFGPNAAQAIPTSPSWEGWIRPPHYTGKPTLYLNEISDPQIEVPIGAKLQLRLYGQDSTTIKQSIGNLSQSEQPSNMVELTITQSGELRIDGPNGRIWQVVALPDLAPSVELVGEIGREADGRFKQPYRARDDYGLTGGQIEIQLDLENVARTHGLTTDPEPIAPVTLDLILPIRGKRDLVEEEFRDDLSKSILANMPVTLTFSVTDAAMQTSSSDPKATILPGKRFFDPMAAAVIEMRRDLLWSRENSTRSSQLLKALTHRPDDITRSPQAIERIRLVIKDLDQSLKLGPLGTEKRDQIAEELWDIATLLEEGDLASALQRLERAQDRLEEAIRNGASSEEIDQLMREMQQAMRDYTRELAKQAPKESPGENKDQGQQGQTITRDQLQQMLDQIEQLMKEGKTAEAMALMEQLRELLENLEVQQSQAGQGDGDGQDGPMNNLGNTLRDQQDLSDDAYRNMQKNRNSEQGDGQGDQNGQSPSSLADRQRELRDRLNQAQRGTLPGDGSETTERGREELGKSERAMREAEKRLEQGDLSGALDKQAEALQALREGMQEIGKANKAQAGQDQQNSDTQRQSNSSGGKAVDPLGRESGESARIGSDNNIAENAPDQRASKLLDELRRRSGETKRPDQELEYFRRLLDQF